MICSRALKRPQDSEASRRLELVRPRVALVEVATTPPGATVFVDRRDLAPRGLTPITFAVPAGAHHAFVELGGHAPEERDLTATVGQTVRVEVALRALDRKSTRLNSSHRLTSRMPSSA